MKKLSDLSVCIILIVIIIFAFAMQELKNRQLKQVEIDLYKSLKPVDFPKA